MIQLIAALIEVVIGRRHLHRAVVFDVDLGAGLFHDLADHLTASADHFANLVDRNVEHLDARSMLAKLGASRGERLGHFAENVQAAILGLAQRGLHDLFGDAGDLDVHLQRGNAAFGAGHLEVHVAEVILVTEDVGQHGMALVFQDEAHGDARRRPLQRHACVHQCKRGAADRGHRGRSVRTR